MRKDEDKGQRLLGLHHVSNVEKSCTLSHVLVARNYGNVRNGRRV